MLELTISGFDRLRLEHLVLDYNGTLACDGLPLSGTRERVHQLSCNLNVFVITADTFGQVNDIMADWNCRLKLLSTEDQAQEKLAFIDELDRGACACLGNGRNDRLMLQAAGLGVAVMLQEGIASETLHNADIMVPGILPALDLLLRPQRLKASLRS